MRSIPAAVVLVSLALAGCGDSDPLAEEAAGEAYLQERLAREHPSRAPHEIAVLCREASPDRLSCGSSVGAATDAVSPQRWQVRLDRSGHVVTAQPIGAAEPRKPKRSVRRPRELVRVSFGPRRRVRVCVDTGRGRRLFGSTRATARKGARVRLSVVEGRPHGVEIRPGRLRPLRAGDRRCR